MGIVHSKDSFFGEVESARMPMRRQLQERWEQWIAGGALCSEMEAATLFVVASVLKKRAGALLKAGGTHSSLDTLCKTSVAALRLLIKSDLAKA